MTTQTFPVPRPERVKNAAKVLAIALATVVGTIRTNTAVSRSKLQDHGLTLLGFGCISGASFLHSPFLGLLVTGILLLVFEWKIGDDE